MQLVDHAGHHGVGVVAEELAAPVITCDAKLAAASGPRCEFELIC